MTHDTILWVYPIFTYLADGILHGHLPLWNPFSHSGEPLFFAYLQMRLFDPIDYIVIFIGSLFTNDLTIIFLYDRVTRLVVSALGVHLLLRRWAGPTTRIALPFIAVLSSMTTNGFHQPGFSDQFYCAPFLGICFFNILEGKHGWSNWFFSVLLLGQCLQSYFFVGPITFGILIFIGYALFRYIKFKILFIDRGTYIKALVCIVLLLAMSGPSLVGLYQQKDFFSVARSAPPSWQTGREGDGPFQEDVGQERSPFSFIKMPYEFIQLTGTPVRPIEIIGLLSAKEIHLTILSTEARMFYGSLAFVISLIGLFLASHKLKSIWLLILFIFGTLMLGPYTPMHRFLYEIYPPLWVIRHTEQFLNYFMLAMLFFFVLGSDYILKISFKSLPKYRGGLRTAHSKLLSFLLWCARLAALFATVKLIDVFARLVPSELVDQYISLNALTTTKVVGLLFVARIIAQNYFPLFLTIAFSATLIGLSNTPTTYFIYSIAFIFLPVISYYFLRHYSFLPSGALIAAAVIFITTIELTLHHLDSIAQIQIPRQEIQKNWPVTVGGQAFPDRRIAAIPEAPTPPKNYQVVRYPELLARIGVALEVPRSYPLSSYIADANYLLGKPRWNTLIMIPAYRDLILSGLDAKIIEAIFAIGAPTVQFRQEAQITKDFIADVRSLNDDAVKILLNTVFLDAQTIPTGWTAKSYTKPSKKAVITMTAATYDNVSITVRAETAGFLYFIDGFSPDWKATINGVSAHIFRANGNFKAVEVPAGISRINFIYQPVAQIFAIRLFFAAQIISAIMALLCYLLELKRGNGKAIKSRSGII